MNLLWDYLRLTILYINPANGILTKKLNKITAKVIIWTFNKNIFDNGSANRIAYRPHSVSLNDIIVYLS